MDPDLVRRNRALLLNVAIRLFEVKGFHNTTIADIAAKAKMSVGSVYRYVPKKEDFLLLLFTHMTELYEGHLMPIVAASCRADEKLRQAIAAYIHIIDKHSDLLIVAYRESYALDHVGLMYAKRREEETNAHFEEILRLGVEEGTFRPVDLDLVAYNIVFAAHMWALKRWHFHRRMTVEEYIDAQVAFILRGLRPETGDSVSR